MQILLTVLIVLLAAAYLLRMWLPVFRAGEGARPDGEEGSQRAACAACNACGSHG